MPYRRAASQSRQPGGRLAVVPGGGLAGVSLGVAAGDRIGVVGQNGGGKSTRCG
jgi:ABC-type polysaccharide/polyol phosphate transport system ATPase subunit